jgi:hypothetical protein
MEMISLQGKTNFFEKRVGEYAKSGVGVDRADQTFAPDASFYWETNKHTYKNAHYISHQHYPLSHMRLLPRLYKSEHQTCEQRSQYSQPLVAA